MSKDLVKMNKAWEDYVDSGHLNYNIDSKIEKSWNRCREYKVDPLEMVETPVLKQGSLKERLTKSEKLIRIASPIMEDLYRTAKGSNLLVLLTDCEGYILKSIGNEDFGKEAKDVHLIEGANWNERIQGTNAIGTAIEEESSLNVYASEHFVSQNHLLTCSAAPIFSSEGDLMGVLDISRNYQTPHIHTLGIVEVAAQLIQKQILVMDLQDNLAVSKKKEELFLNLVSDGLITLDKKGVITQVNQKGGQILGYSARDCIGKRIDEFFTEHNSIPLQDISGEGFYRRNANRLPGKDCHIISNDSEVTDLVIRIDSSQNIGAKQIENDRTDYSFADIIGESEAINEAIELAMKVAVNDSTILLTGESGTGKELFAQAIHNKSFREEESFVTVNCGALPKDLIESELFGYQEGAFTGARQGGKPGKFQVANGGTLFLDEIGELPLSSQVKLLRALQERKISPLGSNEVVPVDVRVIAATNKDLNSMVEEHKFREDLYYRLNVIQIEIPPLKERGTDILILAKYLLKKLGKVFGEKRVMLSEEVKDLLMAYHWPGNVRELENIIERILNLVESEVVKVEDLPDYIVNQQELPEYEKNNEVASLKEAEAKAIKDALEHFDGNVTRTAEHLQIARNTLYRKIKEYNIEN
ncbi:sigma-54-dependent Fis family transcriptional regulator [Fuchsiella alkaliacetigena]|uniref:sigma-54-dependent Fis family transcriptional regulator n=1 Tax=Fuchsiella alkaliacetigena TaxID=957042 RepID=UPI00200B85A5|nr:sigma-54-dependent Fis family transcriptional regulator [Fuchsiella alkaliacetigena]MCK8824796.1 sigma-54-dependent Fis family transcriptional regulator [Fuchsiella alkaliacetigena]